MAMAMFNYSHTPLRDFQLFGWLANKFVGTTIFWITVFSPFLRVHYSLDFVPSSINASHIRSLKDLPNTALPVRISANYY